jgi:hypothetical protein
MGKTGNKGPSHPIDENLSPGATAGNMGTRKAGNRAGE